MTSSKGLDQWSPDEGRIASAISFGRGMFPTAHQYEATGLIGWAGENPRCQHTLRHHICDDSGWRGRLHGLPSIPPKDKKPMPADYNRAKTRTELIHIRVTPIQKESIESLAQDCGLTITELICQALLNGVVPIIKRADPRLSRHLAMMGNLLNQIAAACNLSATRSESINLALVLTELQQIRISLEIYAP